jgi:hydrogenase maturation factor HypF (carbamoyltransferase family)
MIKTAISFKLAGVDEQTISLGLVESLANFIGNEIDNINSSYEVTGVSLCGDLFTNERFNLLVEKNILKNFKIYYNKEFVIQK